MTSVADFSSNDAVLSDVLAYIAKPRTIEEVAENFGWHSQTARRYVWQLRNAGRAKELTRRQSRQKMWQAKGGTGLSGEVLISTTKGTVALADVAGMFSDSSTPVGNIISGALSYLWRRSFYKQLDQTEVQNRTRQGTLDPFLEVRVVMMEVFIRASQQVEVLAAMVRELPELWQDGSEPIKMLGNVDRMEMEANAEWFEAWVRDFQERSGG